MPGRLIHVVIHLFLRIFYKYKLELITVPSAIIKKIDVFFNMVNKRTKYVIKKNDLIKDIK